jgi:hypothetical protein
MILRSFLTLSFLLLMSCSSFAQDSSEAKGSYDATFPNYRYGMKVSSIQDVDFKNLKVSWHGNGIKLRDGGYKQQLKFGNEEVHLDLSAFLDSPGGGTINHAVIDLDWHTCGGTCTVVGRIQILELRSGHPTVVQQIEYDRRAPGTGVRFDRESQILTLTGRTDDHSPDCCPESVDVMHFEWDGKNFVFKDAKTVAVAKQ